MKINKLIITSNTGHFGTFLGYDDRYTYPLPPPSTVIGILQTIYNRNIDNFIFGYTFKSDLIFKDDITMHKLTNKGRLKKNGRCQTDIKFIELHYNCKLNIYTNIKQDIEMNYILCMGRAGNIAKLHFPIKEINLINKKSQGFNQYTPKEIGDGSIEMYNLKSQYVSKFNSYDHQVGLLRFNKVFNYDKYYDEEVKQNIFLWEMKNKEVKPYYD